MASIRGNMHNLRHGHVSGGRRSPEYKAWEGMWQRCTNPKNASWKNYGGRGITVDPLWSKFDRFIADMGPRPSPKHSLDRRDNEKGYSASNCRWATPSEQQSNTRGNRWIEAFGERKTLSDWARDRGLNLSTLWRRIVVHGWDPEQAIGKRTAGERLHEVLASHDYESVEHFLRENPGVSRDSIYKYGRGESRRPSTIAKVEAALKSRRAAPSGP